MEFDWQAITVLIGVLGGSGVALWRGTVFVVKNWKTAQLTEKKDETKQLPASDSNKKSLIEWIRRDVKKERKKVGPKPNRSALPPSESPSDIPFMRLDPTERFQRFLFAIHNTKGVLKAEDLSVMAKSLCRDTLLDVVRLGGCYNPEGIAATKAFELRDDVRDFEELAELILATEEASVCYAALSCFEGRRPYSRRVIESVYKCVRGEITFSPDFDDDLTDPCIQLVIDERFGEEECVIMQGTVVGDVKKGVAREGDKGGDYMTLAQDILKFWNEKYSEDIRSFLLNESP